MIETSSNIIYDIDFVSWKLLKFLTFFLAVQVAHMSITMTQQNCFPRLIPSSKTLNDTQCC